jgi:hypothetical protein
LETDWDDRGKILACDCDGDGKVEIVASGYNATGESGTFVLDFNKEYSLPSVLWPMFGYDPQQTGFYQDKNPPYWVQSPQDANFYKSQTNTLRMTAKSPRISSAFLHFDFQGLPAGATLEESVLQNGKTLTLHWDNPIPGRYPMQVKVVDEMGFKLATSFVITVIDDIFVRGDANFSEGVDLADAITIFQYMFDRTKLTSFSIYPDAMDIDDNGAIDISDPINLLEYLFLGTKPAPAAPFPLPGYDQTPDSLRPDGA